jgi:tetratricopeptide (TPR) repeat protein
MALSARLIKVTVTMFLLSLGVAYGTTSSIDFAKIEKAIDSGDLTWAQRELENHVLAEPDDARAHMLLGIVYDEQRQPDKAQQELQRAVQLTPRDAVSHINLGKHYARSGHLEAAGREFERAIQLDPRNPTAHDNLGLLLLSGRHYKAAREQFQQAVEASHNDPNALLHLLQAQFALKDFGAAHTTTRQLAALLGSNAAVYGQIGAMQAQAGDYAGGIENLKRARALDANSYVVNYNLGLAYYKNNDPNRAAAVLENLRASQDTAELENLLGSVYEAQGNYLQAVTAFKKGAELDLKNEDYRLDFIFELLAHRSYDAAIAMAQAAVHDFPGSIRLPLALGIAYFGRGRQTEAVKTFSEACQRFPDADLPVYFLANATDLAGETSAESQTVVAAYSARHPDWYWPYYFLGKSAYQRGIEGGGQENFEKARRLLEESLRRNPSYADAHYELANVKASLRLWKEAVDEYKKAIALKPDMSEAHYKLSQAYRHAGELALAQQELQTHQRLKQKEAEDTRTQRTAVFVYQLRQER